MTGVLRQVGRDLLYLVIGGVTATLAMVTWTTGLGLVFGLAILIVGIPVVIVAGTAFRWVAELDRQNARLVLGGPIGRSYRDPAEPGLWPLLKTIVTDPQTGRDTAWLVVHSVLGLTFAIIAVTLVATTLGIATIPAWAWSLPQDAIDWGPWQPDTTGRQLTVALCAIPLALITLGAVRGMAAAEAGLARWLLAPRAPVTPLDIPAPPPAAVAARLPRYDADAALSAHVAGTALIGVTSTVIWLLAGRGDFWPAWVVLSLALTAALHLVAIRFARSRGPVERLRTVAEGGLVIVCYLFGVWLLDGAPGSFWPVWPALAIALVLAAAAVVVLAPWSDRDELSERIAVLTRSRRDTVEAQTTELRRIERDLHDGAQARLVALSMQLGRAEARLADRPEDAQLVREARAEASAAIAELRDLARGIAPPVLVDRGLVAAIEALARRQAGPVAVEAGETGRLPAAVESCAYFVCAEALTNIAKHAPGAQATVRIAKDDGTLRLTIADDGPGGADSAGSGLAGLRHRVQALDGRLAVASASGGGTTITAEIPCAS